MPLLIAYDLRWQYTHLLLFTSTFWGVHVLGSIGGLLLGLYGKTRSALMMNATLLFVGSLLLVVASPYSENVVWLCGSLLACGCSGAATHCIALVLRNSDAG